MTLPSAIEPPVTRSKIRQMWSRMTKVARLDGATFLELRNDSKATGQATAVLALTSLSYGVGLALFNANSNGNFSLYGIVVGIFATMLLSMIALLIWSMTSFLVGTKLFKGATSFLGLLRPLFFSSSPGLLLVFISIPVELASRAIAAVVLGWMLIAEVFAIKNAMGFTMQRSMLTFIVGFFIVLLIATTFGGI